MSGESKSSMNIYFCRETVEEKKKQMDHNIQLLKGKVDYFLYEKQYIDVKTVNRQKNWKKCKSMFDYVEDMFKFEIRMRKIKYMTEKVYFAI